MKRRRGPAKAARTRRRRAWQKVKQGLAIGIGPTKREIKEALSAAEDIQRLNTRIIVFDRDTTCRYCLGDRWRVRSEDQMHEDPSRAKTRGLPPEQRFNRTICVRACPPCHEDLTGRLGLGKVKMRTHFVDPEKGFDGPIVGVK